ncbi:MAG TPA: NepR family anti-sigma factor [Rhizomicrobium sp.]|nr:NepR family anti-sigma factor [Rhizomicrobium sp.]
MSGARAHRTENLAKEHDHDRDNTRAVRARQRAIGRELRRIYDGVVNEPIPEEFLALLKKIDDAGGGGQGSTGKTS